MTGPSDPRAATTDPYAATVGAYDLLTAAQHPARTAALDALLPRLRPDHGPVLDVGAGSGATDLEILRRVPTAEVYALEPSPAMRALALAKIAEHPSWFPRVTVRPEDFFSAPLPEHLGGGLLLGVIGHFDPGERAALLAELALRLPPGGVVLMDLPTPERPTRVEAFESGDVRVGELSYRLIAEAWPLDTELMRWRRTYLSLEGERVLTETTVEHRYRHPAPARIAAEAEEAGFEPVRLPDTAYLMLTRR